MEKTLWKGVHQHFVSRTWERERVREGGRLNFEGARFCCCEASQAMAANLPVGGWNIRTCQSSSIWKWIFFTSGSKKLSRALKLQIFVSRVPSSIYRQQKVLSRFPVCCWIDWSLMIKSCLIESAIHRQQKVLSRFPVCCWIDWLLIIKNCLIESGPPCTLGLVSRKQYIRFRRCQCPLVLLVEPPNSKSKSSYGRQSQATISASDQFSSNSCEFVI
jgi:hypothetical protein